MLSMKSATTNGATVTVTYWTEVETAEDFLRTKHSVQITRGQVKAEVARLVKAKAFGFEIK